MRALFVETPPSLEWTPKSAVRTGGRRHPAFTVTGEQSYCYLNLSAAAVLRENGFDVSYIHSQSEQKTMAGIKKQISRLSPQLVVIDVQHVKLLPDFEIAKAAKETGAKVAFVGPFATALNKKMFEMSKSVDVVAFREYDYTILEIAKAIEKRNDFSGIKGIFFRKKNAIKFGGERAFIENLDNLPLPAFDLVDLRKFVESVFIRLPCATTITSRGCPFNCIFCTFPNTIYSHKFRAQSPKRVLEEARFLRDNFGIREIRYDDDTFEVDKKRVFEICDLFKKEKMDLTWQPQCRPDLMTDELCKKMAGAGCIKILFGVESGDDYILKKINKGMTAAQMEKGVMKARKAGIYQQNCFMFGFPWETKESMKKTFDYACRLNGEFTQFAIATPLPMTPFYEIMDSKGLLVGEFWERDSFHAAGTKLPHISKGELEEFAKKAYSSYYKRPQYLAMMLRHSLESQDKFLHFFRLVKAFVARKREGWA